MIRSFDIVAGMVGDEQAEFDPMVVFGLEEEVQAGMFGVGLDGCRVDGFGVVVPVPAECEPFEAMVGGEVDLLLHSGHGVVTPAPYRFPFGEFFDHAAGKMGRSVFGPGLSGVMGPSALAGPAVEVVGTNRCPGGRFIGLGEG